jgi:hypothetical protein
VVIFSLNFLHQDLWDNVDEKIKKRIFDSNVGAVFL